MIFGKSRTKRWHANLQASDPAKQLDAARKLFATGDDSGRDILLRAMESDNTSPIVAQTFAETGKLAEVMPQIQTALLSTNNTITAYALSLQLMHAPTPQSIAVLSAFLGVKTWGQVLIFEISPLKP